MLDHTYFLPQSPRDIFPLVYLTAEDHALHYMEKLQVDYYRRFDYAYPCGCCCCLLVFDAGELYSAMVYWIDFFVCYILSVLTVFI